MLEYRTRMVDDERHCIEFKFCGEIKTIMSNNFDYKNKNHCVDFYNECGLIEDGMVIIYNVPTLGDLEPVVRPIKHEKYLNQLMSLFSKYCANNDEKNAQRIYNIVCVKSYICSKVLNDNVRVRSLFSLKEAFAIDNEYNSLFTKKEQGVGFGM